MDMWNKIVGYLWYAGIGKESYTSVMPDLERSNRGPLRVFSSVAAVFLGVLFALSFVLGDIAAYRWLYFTFMLLMLPIVVVSTVLYSRYAHLLMQATYLFVAFYYGFAIMLGTVGSPNELASSFIALLLTISLVVTDRPIRMVAMTLSAVVVFVVMCIFTKSPEVMTTDIINGVIFGSLSCVVSTYIVRIKAERYVFERKTIMLSEIDLLTGLKNRNSYERNLPLYPYSSEDSIACVYMDVNGLHEVNNTQGHKAGDTMLQVIAENVRFVFGTDHSYRIGGDEFIVFLPDADMEEVKNKIASVKDLIARTPYHISIGWCREKRSGLNMDGLIHLAEAEMYAEKTAYYREKGIVRR